MINLLLSDKSYKLFLVQYLNNFIFYDQNYYYNLWIITYNNFLYKPCPIY